MKFKVAGMGSLCYA